VVLVCAVHLINSYFDGYDNLVTELLVRAGASVNVSDLWKFTPLHEAAAKGTHSFYS